MCVRERESLIPPEAQKGTIVTCSPLDLVQVLGFGVQVLGVRGKGCGAHLADPRSGFKVFSQLVVWFVLKVVTSLPEI